MNASFWPWVPSLLEGALVSVEIAVGAFLVGALIGGVVAFVKLRGHGLGLRLANAYTTICRSVPELLLILFLFFSGGDLLNRFCLAIGIEPVELNGFVAGVVVLGIVQGAYIAEILRGAIQAVPRGQIEAARALAMPALLCARRITLPAMLPYAMGGLTNLWLVLVKDTALISVVGYSELLYSTKQAAGTTKHYFEFYIFAAFIYFILTTTSSSLLRLVERRFSRWMRPV